MQKRSNIMRQKTDTINYISVGLLIRISDDYNIFKKIISK